MNETMRYPNPDTVNARIAANVKLSQKVRLAALRALACPSLALLARILNEPKAGSRLIGLARERFEQEMLRRELRQHGRTTKTTTTGNHRG
jgi:hypothetical protein